MSPWTPDDAPSHTKKASTPKSKRQWRDVANSTLARTGDDGRAIREANAVVGRSSRKGSIANIGKKGKG